uniref:WD repeat, SAM and U-box domain-containing protein 1 n=1 Tax=Neolamprologus brichardi TaxID=32507 RepID=A0A3Q4HD25_NEOBR
MESLICTLRHHTDEVTCCAFSPSLQATSSGDKTLRVYTTADFSELPLSPLRGHGYGVHCCCFSSCGSFLLSCSTDCSVEGSDGVIAHISVSSDSLQILFRFSSDSLHVSKTSHTQVGANIPLPPPRRCATVSEASVVACCFSPCAQMFATGCTRGDLKLWDAHASLLHAEKDAHDLGVTCCCFAPQGCGFFGSADGCCVEFRLASCGQDSQLKIWIVSQREGAACTMKLLQTLTSQTAPVLSCAFSSDGEWIVSGSVDKSVAVYDAVSKAYVTAVALSPTFPWIATGSMDRPVNVWRIGDGDDSTGKYSEKALFFSTLPGHSGLLLTDWSEDDVQTWLRDEGLVELVGIFKANNIDGPELSQLNKETAAELGIESVGLRGRLLRRIEALKAEQNGSEAPDEFLCPITRELRKDPVIAADGYSYERESIESWIRGKNKTSPMTNLPLQTTLLTPNRSLKMAITRWKSNHETAAQSSSTSDNKS